MNHAPAAGPHPGCSEFADDRDQDPSPRRRRTFRESDATERPSGPPPASEKQLAFITSLMSERELTADQRDAAERQLAEGLNVPTASKWIERLLTLPKRRTERRIDITSGPDPEAGMYRRPDGAIMRVYLGQQSGQMLAKKLVDTGEPHPEDPSITLHKYDYMGKASRFMSGAERLTLDEAKEYGRMSGSCCVCGRRLDVPESVEAGIGPVCGGRV